MATLVLQAAGQAAGGLLGPVGAIVGRAAGAITGNIIDQRLLGENSVRSYGRIDDLSIQTSSEGNPIPKVFGRMRIAGTVIWATEFQEHYETQSAGKGGGPKVRDYYYTASFAVALCEGPIARVSRVWADGEPLDLEQVEMRVYEGSESQDPDPLIEAIEGSSPAYRGLAYVVFEHLPVTPFGNRIPQLTFEVIRPVGKLEPMIRAVTMIPGSTEFGYHPEQVKRVVGPGERSTENRHLGTAASDIEASLDELQAICPNIERIALVVSWFGDDLRAGHCSVRPCVEAKDKETDIAWVVAGETRRSAKLVSLDSNDRPYYGGTPSDESVFAAIKAIKRRGLKVVFYPFLLMDVPPNNGLEDPYGADEQGAFPWRGRITVSPSPGQSGSPDGTAAADSAVDDFVGRARPGDFSGSDAVVNYSGPAEWSHRRMMLHYAKLTKQAGGVDAFLIGSELRGLTTIRGANGYPFVDALKDLVVDVRSIVGSSVKLSYAADWTEYFGHHPGNGDVTFHLDPLWADNDIDFIGIDNYWPLSDWRDGEHADQDLAHTPHDVEYLTSNIYGGEGFDWYYKNKDDRINQIRTPISDGDYGKHWVFRFKDLRRWWRTRHYNRVAGVEDNNKTSWVPRSKPVWFTEVGCPAVDRGANQPNVFYDPKSSESRFPYFSSGRRDDQMQRSYLEAMLGAFDPEYSSDIDNFNPISTDYNGRMVDPATVHVWTWDSRPWPAFPHRLDVWSDGDNWERGHWLSGRLGGAPFAELVGELFASWDLDPPEVVAAPTVLDGFIVASPQSLRSVLEPLTAALSVVAVDTGTGIRFAGLDRNATDLVDEESLVDLGNGAPLVFESREEASSLPIEQRLRYFDSGREYQVGSASFSPPESSALQTEEISVSASMNDGLAAELAQTALAARWSGRTKLRFALPPSEIDIMPGDVINLREGERDREVIVEEIDDLGHREVTARTLDRSVLAPIPRVGSPTPPISLVTLAPPVAFGLNLPLIDDTVQPSWPHMAVFARPWPNEVGVWRATSGGAFNLVTTLSDPVNAGQVVGVPRPGRPTSRWDYGDSMDVVLFSGQFSSRDPMDVLEGANAIAVNAADGSWEVIQFQNATLIGERTYRLTNLLRGQAGTEDATAVGILPGAFFAVIDAKLPAIESADDMVGVERTFRVGPLDEGIGGLDVTTFDFTVSGRAKKPLSPVHGRAVLNPLNGVVIISWIRRTRIGGDQWLDGVDVPLGESEERYLIEILDGTTVKRSAERTVPSYNYSLARQTADFGGPVDTVSIRVAQIAPGFGAGVPYEVTLNVQQP
ncbi:MAG: glycoside hydrolase TIM-barrel-like domain-containing protein [Pseudomonadota bacterium]